MQRFLEAIEDSALSANQRRAIFENVIHEILHEDGISLEYGAYTQLAPNRGGLNGVYEARNVGVRILFQSNAHFPYFDTETCIRECNERGSKEIVIVSNCTVTFGEAERQFTKQGIRIIRVLRSGLLQISDDHMQSQAILDLTANLFDDANNANNAHDDAIDWWGLLKGIAFVGVVIASTHYLSKHQ